MFEKDYDLIIKAIKERINARQELFGGGTWNEYGLYEALDIVEQIQSGKEIKHDNLKYNC